MDILQKECLLIKIVGGGRLLVPSEDQHEVQTATGIILLLYELKFRRFSVLGLCPSTALTLQT
jgi:hypothetical protein